MSSSNHKKDDQHAVAGVGARWCDACAAATATVFCRAEASYLCPACDSHAHYTPPARQHERVLICEACEREPAAVTCPADAAALCAACDLDVHSASPLAARHRRSSILPLSPFAGEDVWMNSAVKVDYTDQYNEDMFFHGEEVDQYLDLSEFDDLPGEKPQIYTGDGFCGGERGECVVPVNEQQQKYQPGFEYEASSNHGFNCSAYNSHSVSLSSMNASIVPDTTTNDISNLRNGFMPFELFASSPLPPLPQFSTTDREMRVLRYKDKRKMRNFEKTIRYASRKAYAEARPRIKGRFVRRKDVEFDAKKRISSSATSEGSYGVVPSI